MPRNRMVTTKNPEVARVEKLVARMREFSECQDACLEFLGNQDWKVIGFKACHTFWAARMGDVDVSIPVIKAAAFVMFEEGLSPRRVATTILGLAIKTAVALHRQWSNGLSHEQASYTDRITPKATAELPRRKTIFINLDVDEWEEWDSKAGQLETSISEFVYEAARAAFADV